MRSFVTGLFFGLAYLSSAQAELISALISDQGDTVHLELSGVQNWDYDLRRVEKSGKDAFELTVGRFDEASVKILEKFKNEMITSVAVDKNGPDGKYILRFENAGSELESFDYLTDQPSRLIVDFFPNVNKVKSKEAKLPKKEEKIRINVGKKNVETKSLQKQPRTNREPATTDILVVKNDGVNIPANELEIRSGVFDGADLNFERFKMKDHEVADEDIIRSKQNYYIPFPMLQTENHYWEKMKIANPIYEISPKNSDENKQARLLLTLFDKKRYAVYLKTVEWFKNKYPNSEYGEIVDFMTADVYRKLWEEKLDQKFYEIAQTKYKQCLQNYPNSPLLERTSMALGYSALEKADALGAIRIFNEHQEKNYAGSPTAMSNDLAKLGIGASLAKLNRFTEASDVYDALEKNSPHREIRAEASYRKGDVFVQSKDFKKAVELYKEAIKKYPENQTEYPNAFYNQAEALFGMGDYVKSLDVYLDFIKKFPSHQHAAFAMTRLGELLEIMGADKAKVVGAYLETFFRYGENDNTIIARLRLANARMKSMKPKEVEASVKEMLSLVTRLDLPNVEQFATILISDGYTSRNEHNKAIDLLTTYYKQNPTTVDRDLFGKRIVGNITEEIGRQIRSGNFINALKIHKKHQDGWLKNHERLDTKFYVAKAFEDAGAHKVAEKNYRDVLNQIYAIKGNPKEKELLFTQHSPNEDELNLRLAMTSFQQKKLNQAYDYLKNIKSPDKLPENQQIERIRLAVDLLEKRGDLDSAARYLTELLKSWKGQAALVAEPYLRLAQLELKQEKVDQAIVSLKVVDTLMADSKGVPANIHAQSLELLGKIYSEKSETAEAISAYSRLLDSYEDKRPLASIRYKLGQIYFNKGDLQKAAEVWGTLKGSKNEFWYNLAQEQLKNSDWRGDYKKYIQRIPAMSKQQ